ncbi:hypothetical protein CONLIGDRAFT_713647 [Coniochaeta ligniaria NRRL 30616]|uniref:Uncharacterized protein n=1 Tax=Coniochaeta ligniaria NRRL 30616 TaxID=1408157 RepID=A0A1J7JTW7_9PEZI|nr:hypothetical protein CONLIGDRAFT_713647 [Coniochaeta ligniaria NRRL 30616]
MAPGYRTATTTRRGNRSGYPEHDDFEGLPVRQWRLQEVDIAPPPVPANTQKNDRWSIELPYGMPKDYHLLPPHSQELLRAARSGALYKRKAPPEEEDAIDVVESSGFGLGAKNGAGSGQGLVTDAEKAGDKKASAASKSDPGIKVKVWRRVARDAEVPSHSYLAKRHKNTITLPSKASATQFSGPTVTRVTVRRVDAAGNAYEQTITINDDEQMKHLDGEIVSTTVIAAPVAADPLAQQQPTPVRKRPPPPPHKKKHKGPGRGRKKKIGVGPLPLPLKPGASTSSAGGIEAAVDPKPETAAGPDGIKQEDTGTPDVEMGENSAVASDDEDGDDDEGDEGEDGVANDEGGGNEGLADDAMGDATEQGTPNDHQDHEMEDADERVDIVRPSSIEEPVEDRQSAEAETEVISTQQEPSSSLNLGAPHLGVAHLFSPRQHEGSPLKNVILQSPTEPKTMDFPSISTVQEDASGASELRPATQGTSQMTETLQQRSETTAAGLAMVEMSAQTTSVVVESSTEDVTTGSGQPEHATEAEDLPQSLDRGTGTSVAEDADTSERLEVTHESGGDRQTKSQINTSSFTQQSYQSTSTHSLLPSLREPPRIPNQQSLQPMAHNQSAPEEEGLDLLGGLERELDRQSRTSNDTPAENAAGE